MTEEIIDAAEERFGEEVPDLPKAEKKSGESAFREAVSRHYDGLCRQAEELKKEFPDFDLVDALKDGEFLRMTAPGVGVSVQNAFYATHRQQVEELTARRAAEEAKRFAARSIAAGAARPRESGSIQSAPHPSAAGRAATPGGREQLKRDIRAAAARGEKIYIR